MRQVHNCKFLGGGLSAVLVSMEAASLEMYTEVATQKTWATKFTQNATQCFYRIARRLCCTRLAPIFDIAEVELQSGFSLFGSHLSGDVH